MIWIYFIFFFLNSKIVNYYTEPRNWLAFSTYFRTLSTVYNTKIPSFHPQLILIATAIKFSPSRYGDYTFEDSAQGWGWVMVSIPLICVFLTMAVQAIRYKVSEVDMCLGPHPRPTLEDSAQGWGWVMVSILLICVFLTMAVQAIRYKVCQSVDKLVCLTGLRTSLYHSLWPRAGVGSWCPFRWSVSSWPWLCRLYGTR